MRSQEVLILFSLLAVTAPFHILGMGSLGFRWLYADNFGVLARGANSTDVYFARFIAGVKRAGFDAHDLSPCQRKCRCSWL